VCALVCVCERESVCDVYVCVCVRVFVCVCVCVRERERESVSSPLAAAVSDYLLCYYSGNAGAAAAVRDGHEQDPDGGLRGSLWYVIRLDMHHTRYTHTTHIRLDIHHLHTHHLYFLLMLFRSFIYIVYWNSYVV